MREHFLGPVMYLAAIDPLNAHWSPYLVYDGQQRLTTVSLILKALARHLRDDAAPDGFEPAQIRNDYLLNAYRKGDHQYRLLLKPGDSETLLALIHDRPRPASPSPRILEAYAFFEKRVKQLGPDVSALCAGLRKLRIVAFDLKEGEDKDGPFGVVVRHRDTILRREPETRSGPAVSGEQGVRVVDDGARSGFVEPGKQDRQRVARHRIPVPGPGDRTEQRIDGRGELNR